MENNLPGEKKICAVIAEYNPLHLGHAHHLAQTRGILGDCWIIAILSGSFVQRGEPAILDKWTRASLALQCGADMALELPQAYALQSAEQFALGAVSIAHGLGADALSFGSEYPLEAVKRMAALHSPEPPQLAEELRLALRGGDTYPKALSARYEKMGLSPKGNPNAVLGAMYLRRLKQLGSPMEPIVIPRRRQAFASASYIRESLQTDSWRAHVPPQTVAALIGGAQVEDDFFHRLMLHALRTTPLCDDAFLQARVARLSRQCTSYGELLTRAKTKNITMARLKRACLRTLLGMDTARMECFNREIPVYARVLGYRLQERALLACLQRRSSIPIITSPGRFTPQSEAQAALFAFDCAATDIWMSLNRDAALRLAGQDYTRRLLTL